ncbi:CPBP family intramembrane glutamic endopeptidase [Arthrobacter sp. UC242_113]|uniref:CPBP family intramembrane glutamic endopeptidase n=1 Tax=Arthrobacter sp. UC242_113 TaxID=3374550 RepID=UPI0037563185
MAQPSPAEQPIPARRALHSGGGDRRRARKEAARHRTVSRRGTKARRRTTEPRGAMAWSAAHRLPLFFALAFAISWLLWPLTLLNPNSSPLIPFGPALAAAITAYLAGGKAEMLRLLRQLARWRVAGRWYLAAAGLPCLLVAVSAGLTVSGGAPAPEIGPNPGWFMLLGTFAFTLVAVGLFEELGWRGYALPLLQRDRPALSAALLLGLVWAAWHLPELLSDPTGQRPPLPFLLMVLAQSVLLAWLYNSSGSVPICMVFHAAFNTFGALVFPAMLGPDYLTLWWTVALLHVLAALVVIAVAGPLRLARTLDTNPSNGIT